jgi:hypothetical protein
VNEGIPVSHVATASRTQIHMVGIHDINAGGARGVRGEQLAANGQTLSAFRPQFPQFAGAQPASGGRPRSDMRPITANPLATPAPTAPRATPVQSPRAITGSPASPPASGGGSGRRSDRSANSASASFIGPNGSTPTLSHSTSDPTPSLAQPLILYGPDRSRESVRGSGANALDRAAPPNSLIVHGNSRGGHWQAPGQSSAQTTEALPSRSAPLRQHTSSRPAGTERTHPFTIAEAAVQAPGQPHWAASRAVEPPVCSERPWQPAAPAYKALSEGPRSAPAPSYMPPCAQSYSPPKPSPAPRVEATVSQPVHSISSATAASAPASHSPSSSGRGWR